MPVCKGVHEIQAALSLRGFMFNSGSHVLPDRKQYPFADSVSISASAGQKLCVATEVRLEVDISRWKVAEMDSWNRQALF